MKKRSIIELTPLLDVILLLVFAFLINMQGQSDTMNEQYEELEKKYDILLEQNSELQSENEKAHIKTLLLESEQAELNEKVSSLTEQIGYETLANVEEKETLEKALVAFSGLTDIEGSRLNDLLSNQKDAKEALKGIIDADDIVLEMYKYSFVVNRFFFIDIELIGDENRVVINSEETQIAIGKDDNKSVDSRREKTLKIYDELKEMIDNRQGGDEMVMVTLIVRDPEVYQYAYEIAWNALRELELGASGYRLYKTSYTYTD